ncbi:MAG: hypothetical protein JNJ83_02970 [Verrucomicrobiaceae bacterium]|nr:hypothetical protein [Verrucomicrobiaceae bacterium]
MKRSLLPAFALMNFLTVAPGHAETPKVTFPNVPSWVKGDPVTIEIKRPEDPFYLRVEQKISLIKPQPLTKMDELEKLSPGLKKALPGLERLVSTAETSPLFEKLYSAKIGSIQGGNLLPSHQYFDTATVLNVHNTETGRRAVIFVSDMDVDTDGSDPVRMSKLSDYDDARVSRSYQPLLSYSWAKKPDESATSPFIAYYQDTLGKLRTIKSQVDAAAKADRNPLWPDLQQSIQSYLTAISKKASYYESDLRHRRSLIASTDPFIVIPQTWAGEMQVGDFVAVIHAGKIYPCLIGDTGPTTKSGEGSQKLARAINPKASGRMSAVTMPAVTYIVFPGTGIARGVPDFAKYKEEVTRLLGQLGGTGQNVVIHPWK